VNKPHPIQPIVVDNHGTLRFKANAIVQHLLDHGGIDLNDIASLDFSREDHEQFAQLIGYSLSGASDLSYMSDEVIAAAEAMHERGQSEHEARANALREQFEAARDGMREGVAALFGIHPDDLLRAP
jgi:selenocysteine lyase/cysteine desulfurase